MNGYRDPVSTPDYKITITLFSEDPRMDVHRFLKEIEYAAKPVFSRYGLGPLDVKLVDVVDGRVFVLPKGCK